MTVRHMKIFIQVYKMQNITKAAEQLNMTQPAVTRAIQEIENYYGVCLFERINKRIYRTEISHQLYSQAIHITETFDTIEKNLRNWDTFGFIRVGATVTLGNFLLPKLVICFQKKYPDIEIKVTISNSDNIKKRLLNNQLDIALVENNINEVELYIEPIDKDCILLIVPPNHELLAYKIVELEQVIKYPILLREKGSTTRDFIDNYFAVYGISICPIWESVSTQAIVKAVNCGIGISFLPEQLVNKDIEIGNICTKEIHNANLSRQHYIVWHKNKFLTTSMRNFIDLCKSVSYKNFNI